VLWQSELKDLIWLELRARLTDRTITSQDKYLCEERKNICLLLDEIINFRFVLLTDINIFKFNNANLVLDLTIYLQTNPHLVMKLIIVQVILN